MTSIRAGGGVVWRSGDTGVEVCLVHRPRYDDWSLPKGKLEPGEHPLVAAVREVAEESGVRAVPQVRLPQVRYAMRDGTRKEVEYWSMYAVASGGFASGTEVDAVRWLPVTAAIRLVSYAHDVRVLRDFASLPPVTATLALIRHAEAGEPGTWAGPDSARPLTAAGVAQARKLAPLLALTHPRRLVSATVRRCAQTLDPLAELLDLPIEVDSTFDQPVSGPARAGNGLVTPDQHAAGRLVELATAGDAEPDVATATATAVVCSQGGLIPATLAQLVDAPSSEFTTPKGSGWLLAFSADHLVAADRLTA